MERAEARRLVERLTADAARIARPFGLRFRSISAERADVTRRYGVCYSDGAIKIRLRHAVTSRPLKYSSLVNTLCHELAHLRHFDHGPRFKALYLELLAFARAQGIYRPRSAGGSLPRAPAPSAAARPGRARPAQLTLFGEETASAAAARVLSPR